MATIATLAARANWGGLQGGGGQASRVADSFSVVPPDSRWDRSIRLELRDGDIAPWQSDAEVAQVQAGTYYPHGSVRWTEFWLRVDQVGTDGWWNFITETHLPSASTQAPWAVNIAGGLVRLRHWVGPGSWPTLDSPGGQQDLGQWHHYRIGQFRTTGSNGWYELWRDNTQLYRFDGRTAADTTGEYPKVGWYRGAVQSGTQIGYIAGFRIHDTNPGYPGGGGTPAPTPAVSFTTPVSGTNPASHTGTLDYTVAIANAPTDYTLYIGLAGTSIYVVEFPADAPHTGSLDLSGIPVGGENRSLYAALHNSAGALVSSAGFTVNVNPPAGTAAADLSGEIIGVGELTGDLTFTAVFAVTRVANIGVETVSYQRPILVEINADHTYGARVVWNNANGRFEYLDQQ